MNIKCANGEYLVSTIVKEREGNNELPPRP